MRTKKSVALFMALIMSAFVFVGCKNTDFPSRSRNGISGYEDIVLGGFRSFDSEGPLSVTETLTFAVPENVGEEEYYELMGMYIGDDYVYYYELDGDSLYDSGIAEFDIAHHSIYALAHPDKSVLIDEWTKRAAVNIVTKDDAEGKMNIGIFKILPESGSHYMSEGIGERMFRHLRV